MKEKLKKYSTQSLEVLFQKRSFVPKKILQHELMHPTSEK